MRSKSFPLAALFIVVVTFATLAAAAKPIVRSLQERAITSYELTAAVAVVGGFGAVLGGIVGLCHYHAWRGLALGSLTGWVVGSLVAPTVFSADFTQLIITVLGGSALMLVIAAAYRLQ